MRIARIWGGFVSIYFLGFLVLAAPVQAGTDFKLLKDIEVHGFASSSYTYNFNNPGTNLNNLRIFDTDANSFKFDVGELVFLKEASRVGDIGFRVDLTYGFSVPPVTQSAGSSSLGDADDFDVQQGYVSWHAPVGNGLQIDLGKFITHIGAEVIEGYDGWNYNFSRSFLFGLAIPFTHTGVRASYTISDQLSIMGVIANGWDNASDNNDSKSIGFQIAYAPTDNLSLYVNWMGGNEVDVSNNEFRSIWDFVFDLTLSDEVSLQMNVDIGTEEETGPGGSDADWFGVAGIARYNVNKWFAMNARVEYFEDHDDVRIVSGFLGHELWEFTLTPEFKVRDNMIVRVEYRHDDSNRLVFSDGAGLSDTQDTIAVNALVYF